MAEFTAMVFNDRAADIQPNAHALLLGGEKRREQLFGHGRIQARPIVADAQPHALALAVRRQSQRGPRHLAIAHCLDGIIHQIQQHLLQQHPVGIQRQTIIAFDMKRHPMLAQHGPGQRQRVFQ